MKKLTFFMLALLLTNKLAQADEIPAPLQLRQAARLSIALMQKSVAEYPHHAVCFSCHHQGIPTFALTLAQKRGYKIDEAGLAAVVQYTEADLRRDLVAYQKGQGQPGAVTRAGYAMLALDSGKSKRDDVTAAVTGFLLQRDKEQGFWHVASNRPPSEASAFTDTLLAIRALKAYAEPAQSDAIKARIDRARIWLEQATPKDTEDRAFRLWGMQEAGTEKELLEKTANELLSEQKDDGGWAQLPGINSDAYATGTVLTILSTTGLLPANKPEYQRGLGFLLKTQQPDGSWHVVTRSKPVQPYFESGFPHGKDQFISMAATGWATAAIVLAQKGQ